LPGGKYTQLGLLALLVLLFGYVHFSIRRLTANYISRKLLAEFKNSEWQANYARAFQKNSRWYRILLKRNPVGWGRRTKRRLAKVIENTNTYIQKLNDMYTNPSGSESEHPTAGHVAEEKTHAADTPPGLNEEPLETAPPKDATEP
jgi:hypothetical protein